MKLLHLADLHIGKRLREENLLPDQEHILKKILSLVEEYGTDGVMIAGDVYDKSVPSAEAVSLFDNFLRELRLRGQEVFIVAGNHDSVERLSFASDLLHTSGVHISKVYDGSVTCVPFERNGECVNIYLLPFIRPVNARTAFPDETIETYTDAVRTALSVVKPDPEACNLLITHQFVTGSSQSGSEEMTIGGVNNVDAEVFADFDYVALGHIHRRQSLADGKIHYPGTPIKYSLSEAKEDRTATLVSIEGKTVTTQFLALEPLRDLREMKGDFATLLKGESEDFVYIVLTDENEIPDAVRELRKKYPNLLHIGYEKRKNTLLPEQEFSEKEASPLQLFCDLFRRQNGAEISEEQEKELIKLIESVWEEEE